MKKSKKSPLPVENPVKKGEGELHFMPFLAAVCVLALLAAIAAQHLGYAGGTANLFYLQDHGAAVVKQYNALQQYGLPMPITTASASYLFPDIMSLLALFFVTDNPYVSMHLFAVLCVMIAAAGLFLSVREIWGRSAAYLSLPIVGLPSVLIGYGIYEEVFITAQTIAFRGGLLALLPLLLWMSMRVLFVSSRRKFMAAALFLLLFLLHLGYPIEPVWFTMPALLAAAALMVVFKMRADGWKWFGGILTGALLSGELLRAPLLLLFYSKPLEADLRGVSFALRKILKSAELFAIWVGDFIIHRLPLFIIWTGFMIAAGYAIWCCWRQGTKCFRDTPLQGAHERQKMFLFTVLFLLFSVLVSLAVVLGTGKMNAWGRIEHLANHRYILPSIYWPLFWGWTLIAGFYTSRISLRNKKFMAFSATGAVLLLALPSFGHFFKLGGLAEYSSPFLECAEKNAEKHQLRRGLAPADFALYLQQHAKTATGRMNLLPVANVRAAVEAKKKEFAVGRMPVVKHPDKRYYENTPPSATGFNYIVVNWTDEAKYLTPPDIARCYTRLSAPQECFDEGRWLFTGFYFIDGKTVTDFYGEPDTRFRCEGIDFYVYDKDILAPGG